MRSCFGGKAWVIRGEFPSLSSLGWNRGGGRREEGGGEKEMSGASEKRGEKERKEEGGERKGGKRGMERGRGTVCTLTLCRMNYKLQKERNTTSCLLHSA